MAIQGSRLLPPVSFFIQPGRWAALLAAMLLSSPVLAAPVLNMAFNSPPTHYVPGQTLQEVTVTLTNSGDEAAVGASVVFSADSDVTLANRSCVASLDSSCGSGGGSTNGQVAPGGSLTIKVDVAFASDAIGSKTLSATGSTSVAGVANATASHTFARTPLTDLVATVEAVAVNSPQGNCPNELDSYTPGCDAAYTVVFRNDGPDNADGAGISLARSEGGVLSWGCMGGNGATCPTGSGALSNAAIASFPAGGTLSFNVIVSHAANQLGDAGLEAKIQLPESAGDLLEADPDNNVGEVIRTRNDAANLSVSVQGTVIASPATHCPSETDIYTPGCLATYSVMVSNAGPDSVTGALFSLQRDEAPAESFTWTCESSTGAACPSSPVSGPLTDFVLPTIDAGASLTFSVAVMHGSAELYADAALSAAIGEPADSSAPVDIDHLDNSSVSASRDIARRAEIRVEKRATRNGQDLDETYANIAWDYEIAVFNEGPSDVGNMDGSAGSVIDPVGPALLLSDEFDGLLVGSCTPDSDMPCWTLCPSSIGSTVEVVDASDCPVDTVDGSAAEISQRFALRARTGSRLFTTVNVPAVQDSIDVVNVANVSLTSCGSLPGCHDITLMGEAPVKSEPVTVKVLSAASATIAVANVGDGSAIPGLTHSYSITVRNTGYYHLPETEIQSNFPLAAGGSLAGFVPGSVSYQCRAYGGACCFSGGTCGQSEVTSPITADVLDVTSNLPAGGRVEFTVTGMIDPRATGAVELHAEAEPGGGAAGVNDSDVTSLTPQHTLTLAKRLYQRSGDDDLPRLYYEITAGNDGPSFAPGVELADGDSTVAAPADFDFAQAAWNCEAIPAPGAVVAPEATSCGRAAGSGGIGDTTDGPLPLDLMPGGRAVVRIDVPVTLSAGDQVENRATLALDGSGSREARVTTALRASYSLDLQKSDGLEVAHPGRPHTYSITVLNEGPDDAYDVRVRDVMPSALQNVQWTCSAISPVPGDLAPLQHELSPVARPGQALAMSADGHHVYVLSRTFVGDPAQERAALMVYRRNATPGLGYGELAFDPIDIEIEGVDDESDTGGAVEGMENPVDLALSPDGAVLHVLSSGSHRIATFHRVVNGLDPEFGRLSFAGFTATAMSHPRRIVTTGTHVYVSGSNGSNGVGRVEVFRPDSNSFLPMPVAGAAVDAPVAAGPMQVNGAGSELFVASTTTSAIFRYTIATDGPDAGRLSKTAEAGDGETGFIGIGDMVLAANGQDLYVHAHNNGSPHIGHVVSSPTAVTFTTLSGGNSPTLLSGPVRLALTPDGEHLMAVNPSENALLSLRRNPVTGALTGGSADNPDVEQQLFGPDSQGVTAPDGAIGLDVPMALVVSPDNRHVVVASGSTQGPIGPLAVLSRRAPAPQLGFIELDRDGDAQPGSQGVIDSLVAPADTLVRGRFVYVLSKVDSAVSLFERRLGHVGPEDEDGGHLTFVRSWRNGANGISGMANPDSMLLSPDGRSLFVTSRDSDSLVVFSRDSNGLLDFEQALQRGSGNPGLLGAYGMAMDSGSRHLYVAGSYESSIAIFSHHPDSPQRLQHVGVVTGGQNGVTGLNGIRDLVLADAGGDSQLLGVSDAANTVVVFNRDNADGSLGFVQSLNLGPNQRPMALALSPESGNHQHVYVAAQNSGTLHVLSRVLDSTDPQFGRVRALTQVVAGGLAPARMSGPRDVTVSADGKRVYVAAEWGNSLVAFNRYDNAGSAQYGHLAFAEIRSQDIDAVDGMRTPYAVAVSPDSRNVYVAGFGSDAIASFSVGTGSSCSAAGSGDIDDLVTIRTGGAVMYTVNSVIRPDATGVLSNTATATGENSEASDSDQTLLLTSTRLEVNKTNNQVAVVPGETVVYDVTIRNVGQGNVVGLDDPAAARVTDLFGCTIDGSGTRDCSASPFDIDTISWTCSASGSGALDFIAAHQEGTAGVTGLGGVSSLALIPAGDAADPDRIRGSFMVAASVDDSALVFFQRDQYTGALTYYPDARIDHGDGVHIEGARSVTVSQDGRLLFVASRRSDSLSVFGLSGSQTQALQVELLATAKTPTIKGLDQALHAIALPAGNGVEHIYVAGANDHAVAAFAFDRGSNSLVHLGSHVNNQNGVLGLADVEFLVASPDGAQIYALSGSSGSVVQFDRDAATGELVFVARVGSGSLGGVQLNGVSSGAFDASGKYLYLTVSAGNRLVQLSRTTAAGGSFGNLALQASVGQDEQGAQGLLNPRRAALSADGQHLYVTSQAGATLAWFSLHPETGMPTYQGIRTNLSGGVEGLAGATGLVLEPELNQIYVAGTLDRAIAHFQRQSDSWCPPAGNDLLHEVPVNIAAGGQVRFSIEVRVSSQLSGDLVNVAGVEWQSAGCAGEDGTTLGACVHNDSDQDAPSTVADLSITKDDGLAEFDGLAGAAAIAADLGNIYVAAPADNGIGMFQRQDDAATGIGLRYLGVLRSGMAGISGLAGVTDLIASSDGHHVYAASPVDNAVAVFRRDPGNGRLSQIDLEQNGLLGVTGISGARALALSVDGAHLYVAGGFSNSVAIFHRQNDPASPDFGKLQFLTSVQAGVGAFSGFEAPLALLPSPDGKQLYVLGGAADTLVVFARQDNPGSGNFGLLTQIQSHHNASAGVLGMDDVRSLALDVSGAHLYVLGAEAGSLVHFSRNTADGKLAFISHSASEATFMAPELVGAARLRLRVVDDNTSQLLAASAAQDAIAVFDLDAEGKPGLVHFVRNGDEALDPAVGLVDGLGGASDLAYVVDDQVYLYAAGAQDAALTAFALDATGPDFQGAIFDGMGGVAPGDAVTYTIVARNHGPSDVEVARVVDHFPPEFEQVSWTCTGSGGGQCVGAGVGGIDLEVKLPNGGEVRFQATGVVGAQASGRLVNTATVEAIGVLDPDMTNNSATDDDTVLSPAMDLSITVTSDGCSAGEPGCIEEGQLTPGGDVNYSVVAANAGPTYAAGALVGDVLPAALYDVAWTCTPTPYAGLLEQVALASAEFDVAYRALTVDTLGRHVYAVGKRVDGAVERDTVVVFNRDPLTGVLTRSHAWFNGAPLSGNSTPPVSGIGGASDIVITADGRFVFVAGPDSDAIAVFSRDAETGLLTWASQVVDNELGVQGIGGVTRLALSPDGRQLYAGARGSQAIAGFSINATTGALSQVSVIHQSGGNNGLNGISDLAFNETGTLLFVTADANRSLAVFRRAPATGVLTHVLDIEDGPGNPGASLLSPSAVQVYQDRIFVADAGGDAVNLLRFVDGDEPAFEVEQIIDLAALGNSGHAPAALAFVPDQMRLYVAAAGTGQLHLYSLLDTTAQHLASYGVADSAALEQVSAIMLAPNGQQLYTVSAADGLAATLAREPGSRCPLAGSGALGTQRVDIAPGGHVQFDLAGRIFANATGSLTYSVSVDPRVLAHETDPSDNRASDTSPLVPAPDLATIKDRLTPADEVIAGLPVEYSIRVDNHGVSDALGAWIHDELPIFPATNAGLVDDGQWSCAANLPLEGRVWLPGAFESRIADLSALAHTPDGRRWFGASRSGSALVELRLDTAGEIESIERLVDGDDAGGTPISGLAGASHLAVSPDGAHLYVTAAQSNSVLVFAIVADGLHFLQQITSGTLTPGLTGAAFVLVSADGRFVYTAAVPNDAGTSAIALFQRDADSGELSYVERIRDGLGTFQEELNVIRGVKRLHLSADGRHLYAVSTVSESLARFEVDANSGVLSYAGMLHGRSGDATVPGLAGARDMVVTPGDTQLYVLGSDGITLFERAVNGSLTAVDFTPLPGGSAAPRALAMDTWGSRLYLADAEGNVHLLARRWSDGGLEHRFTQAAPDGVSAAPGALLHVPPMGELVMALTGEAGGLSRLDERAISRCLAMAGGNAGFPVPVDLGVGGHSTVDYQATVHPSARGTLRNAAQAVPGEGVDPNPANDEGVDEVLIQVVSDLAISKTGPEVVIAGETAEYVITVTNAGPSNALGIRVMDDLHAAAFLDATWTCETAGEGDSSCASPSGSGSELEAYADLHVGDTLTVTLTVLIDPAHIGPLQNGAYLIPEPEATDPTPNDHVTPPVETEVLRRANLAVTKTRSGGEVVAGLPVHYTVAVHNIGPSDAPEVRVQDFLSPLLRAASWECNSTAGVGHCGIDGEQGQGSINRVVSVPAGATLYYTIDAMLRSSALGTLENTATAQLLPTDVEGQAEDPDLSNNSFTVSDLIITRADLVTSIQTPDAYDPDSSQPMPYQVTVANIGPSDAAATTVALSFSHAVRHNGGELCTPAFGESFLCEVEAIVAGSSHVITLGLSDLPAPGSVLDSTALAESQTDDPVPGNSSASSSTLMRTGVDLVVSIDDGRIGLAPGDTTAYTIRVRNIGSIDALGASVQAPLASGLMDASWTCTASAGASCGAGTGGIDDLVDLPAGGTLTYTLNTTLDPAIDIFTHEEIVQHAEAEVDTAQIEVNDADNQGSDTNLIFKVIFRDGFEEPKKAAVADPQAALWPLPTGSGLPASRGPPPSLPAGVAGCRETARAMASKEGWA